MTITPIPDGQAIRSMKYQIYTEGGKFKHIATVFDKGHADVIAAAPQMKTLIEKAVDALVNYIVPDSGITEHDVVNTMLGIFDGPEYRAAIEKATGQAA